MKKILFLLLALLLALSLAACGAPATTSVPTPAQVTAAVPEGIVTFADPTLEAMVRGAMGRPQGDITAAEAEKVTRLSLSMEWQRYILGDTPIMDIGGLECFTNLESLDLSFNAITDITPLKGLKKLAFLSLGDNPVADIAPLAGLTNLNVLALDNSAVSDLTPLTALTNLKHLYLAGCPVLDYTPLAGIYPGLKSKDFIIASALKELGFIMPENDAVAEYRGEGMSVTVNHSEWGAPGMEDQNNAVKMNLQMDNGYGLTVIYYPEIDVYVFQMTQNNQLVLNYIYEEATGGFSLNASDRGSFERIITDALGKTDAEDILLAPIPIFDDTIQMTFGVTADVLYALPFDQTAAQPEQTTAPYALPYEQLGFTEDTANAACIFEQDKPHYMRITIHRPEWGASPEEWNIEFHDLDVNGYSLIMQYFADEGKWHVYMEKGGAYCAYDVYPATDAKGWEDPSIKAVHQMVGDAFHSQGKELYYKPLEYFEREVQELFGMSIQELYALPI